MGERLWGPLIAGSLSLAVLTFSPTATSPAGADGFETIYEAGLACRETLVYGVGLDETGSGTIIVPEGPGEIEVAFLSWLGTDDITPNDLVDVSPRADSTLIVNGIDVVGVQPSGAAAGSEIHTDEWWYAWSADVGPSGLGLVTDPGGARYDISGWDVDPAHPNGRNGAALTIVYATSQCEIPQTIEILNGVNYSFEGGGKPASTALLGRIDRRSYDLATSITVSHFGSDSAYDGCRPSSLWMSAGADPEPPESLVLFEQQDSGFAERRNGGAEVIRNPFFGPTSTCVQTLNPNVGDELYRALSVTPTTGGSVGNEMSIIDVDVLVPANSDWVAFQLESSNQGFGESGAWGSAFALTSRPATGIGDYVWLDTNSDGLQGADENGVGDVDVTVRESPSGDLWETTTTDEFGRYFVGVQPGCYTVEFEAPAGYNFTIPEVGDDDSRESDAIVGADGVGRAEEVCLSELEYNLDQDAGLVSPSPPPPPTPPAGAASIGDRVWFDSDRDGRQTDGEVGVPAVAITAIETTTGAPVGTTATDADGHYSIDVEPGCYVVEFRPPTDHAFTAAKVGDDDVVDSDAVIGIDGVGRTDEVCVEADGFDFDQDAGLVAPDLVEYSALGDLVWHDENENGIQDPDESAMPGVTVLLHTPEERNVAETVTDENGNYLFDGLQGGIFQIEFVFDAGLETTTLGDGSNPTLDSDGSIDAVGLTPPTVPDGDGDSDSESDSDSDGEDGGTDQASDVNGATVQVLGIVQSTHSSAATQWITLDPGEVNLDLDLGLLAPTPSTPPTTTPPTTTPPTTTPPSNPPPPSLAFTGAGSASIVAYAAGLVLVGMLLTRRPRARVLDRHPRSESR